MVWVLYFLARSGRWVAYATAEDAKELRADARQLKRLGYAADATLLKQVRVGPLDESAAPA